MLKNVDLILTIDLDQKIYAKQFIHIFQQAVYEKANVILTEEWFWEYITKKARRRYGRSETKYYFELRDKDISWNNGVQILDETFVRIINEKKWDPHWRIKATFIQQDGTEIYIYPDCYGEEVLVKKIRSLPLDEAVGNTSKNSILIEKVLIFNFKLCRWEEPDRIAEAFMKADEGFIDIDCKGEDPEKVKKLFIKAITKFYCRCGGTEYGGTNCKRDDYIRDYVEKEICKPITIGTKLYCKVWNTFGGPAIIYDEFGEEDTIGYYQGYGVDNLTTYDHAFKIFFQRSGKVEFIAKTWVSGHCSDDIIEVYYTEDGKINKIDQNDWVEPYKLWR